MRVFIDLISQRLVTGAGTNEQVTSLAFKRGDSSRIEVQFCSGAVAQELPVGATGKFGIKERKKYDGDFVVYAGTWTKEGTGLSALYVFEPNFNTVPLNELLGSGDDDDSNDEAFIDLMAEIQWTVGDVISSTQTIIAQVANDVIKGTEGTPVELESPDEWLLGQFNDAVEKTTLKDADHLPLMDSEAGDQLKKVSLSNLRKSLNLGSLIIPEGLNADGETLNTEPLQAALNLAAETGAAVFIPVGIFASGPLTRNPLVPIIGASRVASVLKLVTAGVLISSVGTELLTVPNLPNVFQADISDVTLDGNGGAGDVGLRISETQFWRVNCVTARGFSDVGFEFKGAVGGYCNDCSSFENGTGYRFDQSYPSAVFGPGNHLPSNLVGLNQCVAMHNTFRGVEYTHGCNCRLSVCQVESNGTAGDEESGGIYVKAVHHTPGSHGLIMEGGWIEDSRGGFHVMIDEADGATYHSFRDVFFHDYAGTLAHAIIINGAKQNRVVFERCRVDNGATKNDIYVTGGDLALIELRSGSNFDVFNSARGPIRTPVFPIAWWPMNEGAGNTANDVSADELHGALSNISWVAGRTAGTSALQFDGTSSNLPAPLSRIFNITDNRVTLSAWIKKPSAPGSPGIVISTGTAELTYVTALIINTAGAAQFSVYNGTTNPEAVGSVAVCDDTWHHICGTYDGRFLRVYADGVLDTKIEASISILAASSPKVICGMSVVSTNKLAVTIEDARVYNSCLPPAEVLNLVL